MKAFRTKHHCSTSAFGSPTSLESFQVPSLGSAAPADRLSRDGTCYDSFVSTAAIASPHPLSYSDTVSRLFVRGDYLYRGILPDKTGEIEPIVSSSWFAALVADGRVQGTEVCRGTGSHATDDLRSRFPLLLRHRRIDHLSYPAEWSWSMWRQLANFILTLRGDLRLHGATLVDFHPYNFAFVRGAPLLLDIGCLRLGSDVTQSLEEFHRSFRRHYLLPIRLASEGHGRLVRSQIQTGTIGALTSVEIVTSRRARWKSSALTYLRTRLSKQSIDRLKSLRTAGYNSLSPVQFEHSLRRTLRTMATPTTRSSWQEYQDESGRLEQRTRKLEVLNEAFSEIAPRSVCDIGCNTGTYSIAAAERGARVVAIDDDHGCIEELMTAIRRRQLPITPVIMDILRPSPAQGLAPHRTLAATDRFRSELVIAFAIVHHIVRRGRRELSSALAGLKEFSARYILVEIPRSDDPTLLSWGDQVADSFSDSRIAEALSQAGKIVRAWPSSPTRDIHLIDTA